MPRLFQTLTNPLRAARWNVPSVVLFIPLGMYPSYVKISPAPASVSCRLANALKRNITPRRILTGRDAVFRWSALGAIMWQMLLSLSRGAINVVCTSCTASAMVEYLGIQIGVKMKKISVVVDAECYEIDETALPAPAPVPVRRPRVVMVPVVDKVSVTSGMVEM